MLRLGQSMFISNLVSLNFGSRHYLSPCAEIDNDLAVGVLSVRKGLSAISPVRNVFLGGKTRLVALHHINYKFPRVINFIT